MTCETTMTTARALKVCLASMAPFVGGAEVAAERLAIGLRDAGHDVFLMLGRSGVVHERLVRAGLRCVISPMRFTGKVDWPLYWLARRRIIGLLRRERPDVVHSNDLPTHQILSDATRRIGIPRICHHRFPFPERHRLDEQVRCEQHLFVSRALMDEMCGESASLRAASREVVYDGLPLPLIISDADRLEVRSRLRVVGESRHRALRSGQIIERKGVADLIRAWNLLPEAARSAAELVIVGDDSPGRASTGPRCRNWRIRRIV